VAERSGSSPSQREGEGSCLIKKPAAREEGLRSCLAVFTWFEARLGTSALTPGTHISPHQLGGQSFPDSLPLFPIRISHGASRQLKAQRPAFLAAKSARGGTFFLFTRFYGWVVLSRQPFSSGKVIFQLDTPCLRDRPLNQRLVKTSCRPLVNRQYLFAGAVRFPFLDQLNILLS
jgi:hypothetical protein